MNLRRLRISWLLVALLGCGLFFAGCQGRILAVQPASEHWVTAWTTAPLAEDPGKETPALREATLRQVVRVTPPAGLFG